MDLVGAPISQSGSSPKEVCGHSSSSSDLAKRFGWFVFVVVVFI